jgi:hypothetical protein
VLYNWIPFGGKEAKFFFFKGPCKDKDLMISLQKIDEELLHLYNKD